MKTANRLTFTTYEASLKLKPVDPIKVIFDNIDWSFVHPLVQGKYSKTAQGADGYDPISLLKCPPPAPPGPLTGKGLLLNSSKH